jgi:hypothetical protein
MRHFFFIFYLDEYRLNNFVLDNNQKIYYNKTIKRKGKTKWKLSKVPSMSN